MLVVRVSLICLWISVKLGPKWAGVKVSSACIIMITDLLKRLMSLAAWIWPAGCSLPTPCVKGSKDLQHFVFSALPLHMYCFLFEKLTVCYNLIPSQVYQKLGWDHLAKHAEDWLLVKYPPNFVPFWSRGQNGTSVLTGWRTESGLLRLAVPGEMFIACTVKYLKNFMHLIQYVNKEILNDRVWFMISFYYGKFAIWMLASDILEIFCSILNKLGKGMF